MKYNEMLNLNFLVTVIILILFIIYKSRLNIIFSIDIDNNTPLIKLNIKYLFNLLNINIQVYPPEVKKNKKEKVKVKNKKEKIKKTKVKLFSSDIASIYKLAKRIRVNELFSDISFGNTNVHFTCFIYVFINTIYGNLTNIIDAQNMYLNVMPNFTQDYIRGHIKIHISPKIEDLFKISIVFIKKYIKNTIRSKNKDGGKNESNRINTKSYGDNS